MVKLVVFKGGTAFNSFLPTFHKSFQKTSYIIPISDDGGSTREIVRVFGGPGIGDIRSTLTRLSDESTRETRAVKALLEMRLDPENWELAHKKWHSVLEGEHPLWKEMTPKFKGLIYGFLRTFEAERMKALDKNFDLRNGSIGNYFFTGARLFFGSIATPVFIYSSVTSIHALTHVLPVVDSNEQLGIAAELCNKEKISGQSNISHPKLGPVVSKEGCHPLSGKIEKIDYTNKFGDKIIPTVNPEVLSAIDQADMMVYGIGSLWTSIIPSLILKGVGERILESKAAKVLLLNSHPDRETAGLTALDYIENIRKALLRFKKVEIPLKACVTHLIYLKEGSIPVDLGALKKEGIEVVALEKGPHAISFEGQKYPSYSIPALETAIKNISQTL